jgi:hypothetical protein
MKRIATILLALLAIALVITGCKGPEGPAGPQGPPGTGIPIETLEGFAAGILPPCTEVPA